MTSLLLLVLSIGLADSLNPSTIAPALYLATARSANRDLAGFTLGVFGVYLAAGLVLTLGPGQLLLAALPRPGQETKHLLEFSLGAGALVLALILWLGRERVARSIRESEQRVAGSSVLLGAGIMLVELPTAFPYFAVLAAIVGSDVRVPAEIALVVLFNLMFVAPLLAIVLLRRVAAERAEPWLQRARAWLDRFAALVLPAVILAVAIVLLTIGGIGLAHS